MVTDREGGAESVERSPLRSARNRVGSASSPPLDGVTGSIGHTGAHRVEPGPGQPMVSRMMSATSVGFVPTLTPAARNASAFACAVPLEPVMIAPACPMRLPGGALNPATYATTGLDRCSAM